MIVKIVAKEVLKTFTKDQFTLDPYQIMEEDHLLVDGKLYIIIGRAFDFEKETIVYFVEAEEDRETQNHWGL
ncbi:hypothetical protein [Fusibacter sp. 3D3]|uniref:hypothetical protein n=1 Tax=Fusibacter sp. 3D3 TaxID=1048380 RepID=UPI000852FCFE|nr:hypothetical protein [Fusibacter sp. 3D3]GAU78586.1 hypothetical protein F3D3_3220 [Fusibacter sp. 3D3]